MIVYHGSNSRFKQLRISKTLVKTDINNLSEGLGIYFSTDYDVAASYGKYVYIIEVDNSVTLDFRQVHVCRNFIMELVNYVISQTGINISRYINVNAIVNGLHNRCGNVEEIGKEIELWLESNARWYMDIKYRKSVEIIRSINRFIKQKLKVYLFNYEIKGVGVIKDLAHARIISRSEITS